MDCEASPTSTYIVSLNSVKYKVGVDRQSSLGVQ